MFLQLLSNGIVTGSVYAIAAVGVSIVYGILRLVNFAYGDVMTFGAFTAYFANTTLGLPMVAALNMIDMAERDGLTLSADALAAELGCPVVETVAVRRRGLDGLRAAMADTLGRGAAPVPVPDSLAREARRIAAAAVVSETPVRRWTHRLDRVLLHPFAGPLILALVMFTMFQAVFAWSEAPIGWI